MSTKQKVFAIAGIFVCIVCLWPFVGAGSLNPTSSPAPTMKTLDEIFSAAASQNPPVGAADARWVVAMRIAEYPGSWDYPGYENYSKVIDLEYSFSIPYDPVTGVPIGSRQLDTVCITKNIDKATAGLGKAFNTGQNLREVSFKFLRPDLQGGMVQYFSIVLTNVRVVGFSQRVVHRGGDEYAHLDIVNFVWERMEWKWIPDNVVEMIQWRTPGSG